jgi:hypothetical protein
VEPDVEDNPEPGVQLYVAPPEAVKVVELPAHTLELAAVADTVGKGLTVTTDVPLLTQPFASVPLTV